MLYALGSNGSAQLGIGHLEDVSSPTRHLHTPAATPGQGLLIPSKICAGGNHTLILYSNGELYIAGQSEDHVTSGSKFVEGSQGQVRYLVSGVSDFSATWEASMLCIGARLLRSHGKGAKGELGHYPRDTEPHISGTDLDFADQAPKGTFVVGLASGVQHSVAVLSNGDVLGWGNGRNGQLGQPSHIVWEPRKIEGLDFKVVKAVCGRQFTYLVGNAREGRHAILGSNKWELKAQAPVTVPGWADIGACWGSIFVLLHSGEILSWGRNDHGQLAPANLPPIARIANGSEHTVALAEDGRVLVWGWGEHGNCGLPLDAAGDVKERWNVLSLPDEDNGQVMGVGAGCATSWIWN